MDRLWRIPDDAAGVSAAPGLPATDLFDALEDGRVLRGPATFPAPRLDTRIREGRIEVRLPEG